ncbi:hypothetical protein POM88_025665 [Heracleum sosnowskyi]|uniref:Uncharacterized protein n=1 Tax=Heracleum sosnowskyi TaxID=360622 RepID=A0AAD8I4J1_9APIA|nr:hypothetical protein POM88_025665 [Heracleum sosnowskyi]
MISTLGLSGFKRLFLQGRSLGAGIMALQAENCVDSESKNKIKTANDIFNRGLSRTVAVKIRINKNRIKADGQLDINLTFLNRDGQGVKREVGNQAKVINKLSLCL